MQPHEIEAVVQADGSLIIKNLPPGEKVKVIIEFSKTRPASSNRYPLHGAPFRYDDPTEPVAVDDWEVNQ